MNNGSQGLTIIGPVFITSSITCTSQEEYDNLSDYDRNQVEQIFPGQWKKSCNPLDRPCNPLDKPCDPLDKGCIPSEK